MSVLSNEGEARQRHERICQELVIVTLSNTYSSFLDALASLDFTLVGN